jgi:hypothetical protein
LGERWVCVPVNTLENPVQFRYPFRCLFRFLKILFQYGFLESDYVVKEHCPVIDGDMANIPLRKETLGVIATVEGGQTSKRKQKNILLLMVDK